MSLILYSCFVVPQFFKYQWTYNSLEMKFNWISQEMKSLCHSQARLPVNGPDFAFNVGVSTAACPTTTSTSRAYLYNRFEDNGGQKPERASSVTEGLWPSLVCAFLGRFRRCVLNLATVVQQGWPLLRYALNGHAWQCIALCAVDFVSSS